MHLTTQPDFDAQRPVAVEPPPPTSVVTVRMSRELHAALRSAAHKINLSTNRFCVAAIEAAIRAANEMPEVAETEPKPTPEPLKPVALKVTRISKFDGRQQAMKIEQAVKRIANATQSTVEYVRTRLLAGETVETLVAEYRLSGANDDT